MVTRVIVTNVTDTLRRSSIVLSGLIALAAGAAGRIGALRLMGTSIALAWFRRPPATATPNEPPGTRRRAIHRVQPWILIATVTALLVSLIVASSYFFLAELRDDALKSAKSNLAHQSTAFAEQADSSLKALDLVLSTSERP
jgi:hypothetical protein